MHGWMLEAAEAASLEHDVAKMGELLFEEYDETNAQLNLELAGALQVAEELRRRVAAQEQQLQELRQQLVDFPRLRAEVTQLRTALQVAETSIRELQAEKSVLHDAAERISEAEIAARGAARGATWQMQLEASSAEARVQAATRRLETTCRQRVEEVEAELAAVRQQLREEHRRDRLAVSSSRWMGRCVAKFRVSEDAWLTEAIFFRWARLPRSSPDLWNMHVYYLHEQEKRHAEDFEQMKIRFLAVKDRLLDFRRRDLCAYWVVQCFLVWSNSAKAQMLLRDM